MLLLVVVSARPSRSVMESIFNRVHSFCLHSTCENALHPLNAFCVYQCIDNACFQQAFAGQVLEEGIQYHLE